MAGSNIKIVEDGKGKKYMMEDPSFNRLMEDSALEEIAVNKPGEYVYVFHRDHGRCRTNFKPNEEEIRAIINNAAEEATDYINKSKPFLDARLSDGSRLNATISPATPEGPTLTITKFRREPFSIVDLIDNGTLSSRAAAFLWTAVEGKRNYPLNILIIGGTGAGKTTTLNTLTSFIPRDERIACIEDTLELSFYERENIVRMESVPGTKSKDPITMNDLLINALRMRPDRLITGEVRDKEARSLFNAMNVGHSAMGTLHANSPSESISRLTNPPMDVPEDMLPLIDIIILQKKSIRDNGAFRRINTIVEVSKSEVGISFNELFMYNPQKDELERTNVPSKKLEKLADLSGTSLKEVQSENKKKMNFLNNLMREDIGNVHEVNKKIQRHYAEKGYFL